MGTIDWPSREGVAGLRFLPKMPAARNSEGVNRLPITPSAARNERRLQPNFEFIPGSPSSPFAKLFISLQHGRIDHYCAPDNFNQRIPRNPFDSHAGSRGSFARREIGPVDLVQRIVLCLMCVEPCLASGRGYTLRERQAEKNLKVQDAIHGAARALDDLLSASIVRTTCFSKGS